MLFHQNHINLFNGQPFCFTTFVHKACKCIFMKRIIFSVFYALNGLLIIGQDSLITFSYESGFYKAPFTVTLNSSPASVTIIYTLDGSNPQTTQNSFSSVSPVTIKIDPDELVSVIPGDTVKRAKTPGIIVRASIKHENGSIGFPQCKSYIFIDKIRDQTFPGGNWPPEAYRGINGHNIDYSMDSAVVNNPAYKDLIDSALLDIPTVSIATNLKNLFDPASGIYVNTSLDGEAWERECSFEMIYPDNTQKFQTNGGIRIRGGWSKDQVFNPKYSLRLIFRKEYGAKELKYPLFDNEGAPEYEFIDLRTEQNCSWTLDVGNARFNTFIRDIFARDSQRDMNWPYLRSNYYHLYINGMYWGLYMTEERADKTYAKSYFKGDPDDYDIIKATELTDGSFDSWKALWTLTSNGFETNANYFAVEGKNEFGQPVQGSQIYCDIDNLIDYMVLVFYTGNFDGPVSKWGSNRTAANFIALKDRTDKSFGYKFFALDFEYAMMVEPIYIGVGLNENRVNIATVPLDLRMTTKTFATFNPQWLHYKLSSNKEYRMRFIDRAYKLLDEDGVFTPAKNLARWQKRENQIKTAIIAESARWGDSQTEESPGFTKVDWEREVTSVKDSFFRYRTDIVIQQLLDAGLYSVIHATSITINGNPITGETYNLSGTAEVVMKPGAENGKVYYTVNGKDPRGIDDIIDNTAIKIGGTSGSFIASKSMIINTRTKTDTEWGPLKTVKILAPASQEDYSMLKVTELNYHPIREITSTDTSDGDDFEFVEFKNIGEVSLNISGMHIDSGIHYTFPLHTILSPQEYYVVANKPSKFYSRYNLIASGNYSGKLSNSGEYILVEDSLHHKILSFTYSDKDPWDRFADGIGYSLVSVEKNPTGDPNSYTYWKRSEKINGNPFSDTVITVVTTPYLMANDLKIYPNPTADYVTIENNNREFSNVTICDLYGKIIYNKPFTGKFTLDFRKLKVGSGIYIVTVKHSKEIKTAKIIYQGY
jgi:hypothetical protein